MKRPRRTFSPAVYAAILKRQDFICACGCKEKIEDVRGLHYDHRVPLWNGGEDSPANLQALLPKHHGVKTSREAGERAKCARIIARGGMTRRRMTAKDKALAKMAGMEASPTREEKT